LFLTLLVSTSLLTLCPGPSSVQALGAPRKFVRSYSKNPWTDLAKTSILLSLTWRYPSLESVTVARRLLGGKTPKTSPLVRPGNMAIRYVYLVRASLGDFSAPELRVTGANLVTKRMLPYTTLAAPTISIDFLRAWERQCTVSCSHKADS